MPRQSDLRYAFEPLRGDLFELVWFTLEEGLCNPLNSNRCWSAIIPPLTSTACSIWLRCSPSGATIPQCATSTAWSACSSRATPAFAAPATPEGLFYTFEHRTDGHTLVLTDRVGGLDTIGTHTNCPVIYQPMSGGDSKEPALMLTDTMRIDTEAKTLALTHRMSLPNHLDLRVLEVRFETDPTAPLIKRAAREML